MNITQKDETARSKPSGAVAWSWRLAGMLAPLAITLVLVTTNVRLATNSLGLHQFFFERHNVPQRSGIALEDLRSVDQEVLRYLNTDVEPLYVEADVNGVRRPLFSEREVLHMADVKDLFHLTWRVQGAAALFLLLTWAVTIAYLRGGAWRTLLGWTRNSAVLTGVTTLAVGAFAAVAFGPLFTLFHRLGFRNDLWLLDSRRDLLVQVYPFGFWQEITLLIGVALLVEAGLLFFVARYFLRRQTNRATPAKQKRPSAS